MLCYTVGSMVIEEVKLMNVASTVHCKRISRGTKDYVYLGRPSKFGNPFHIGKDGTRAVVIKKYLKWLIQRIEGGYITIHDFKQLVGKKCGCWCHPKPCHVDIVIFIVNQIYRIRTNKRLITFVKSLSVNSDGILC